MTAKNYERNPDGERLQFRGINTVLPPDKLPKNKYPFAQNIRAYLHDRISGRATQDSSAVGNLGAPVHSLRRLNDYTPAGPVLDFVHIAGVGVNLFSNATQVNTVPLSGNPISLVPFRPNASVQPWMYVGDSLAMLKVRSDGTCYKMGIKEPQTAPSVAFVPASDTVSLLGPVTVTYWGDSPHSGPTGNYIWKNASDKGGSGPIRNSTPPSGVTTGNSLLFDVSTGNQGVPVAWTQYTEYAGTVSTVGTAVTWQGGNQFGGLSAGNKMVISGVTYTLTGAVTNTTATLTASAGNQTAASYQAAAQSGTTPLFQPALESEGYSDFNFAVEATLYIPAAGTYTLSLTSKDEAIWGIGNSGNGKASWPGPTGGQVLATSGQTVTALNGYPLLPKTVSDDGGGQGDSASISVTFSAPGNYPIEIDYDYWYHSGRTLKIKCNGADIPPIPQAVITDAQYRYIYRSSATGAKSNPSPESPNSQLAVLANNVTAVQSTDPQVDKIDFFRLDSGLENFTYVGTVQNASVNTVTIGPITVTGSPYSISVQNISGAQIGQSVTIDTGGNAELVTIIGLFPGGAIGSPPHFVPATITAVFSKTHLGGVPVTATGLSFNDTLLDTDIAGNPILEFDNFEPFPSIDLPRKGLVSVASGIVTWVSGDQFNVRWLPGTIIIIGTVAYTLNTRPTSVTQLTASSTDIVGGIVESVVPPDGQNLIYEISEPILAAQPLAYLWGPTDNVSFFFGVGDPLRPGTLYWSKGNNPDSAPDTNQQDVTSPSEPLINGCIVNGYGWVASSERAWLIVPNFFNALATVTGTEGSTWTLQLSSLQRGLYMPRCIAVDGGGNVFFRAKDGIFVSPGGQGGKSITDDIYNLFPHEGKPGTAVTIGAFTIFPPDDTLPQLQKMNVANGYLYYDFRDTNGANATLVFDIAAGGWVVDVYQHPVSVHSLEEGPGVNGVLCGCVDGTVRPLNNSGTETCQSIILMPSFDAGDVRALKHWGDIYVEAE